MTIPRWLPFFLGFLTAIGPLSTDMYLPAFPTIESSLHLHPGAAQITLTAWFIGLSSGQAVTGPLSDRFGRRAVLIGGLAVFMLATTACALSQSAVALCVARVVAGLAGSVTAVVPRAVVRDAADGHRAVRMMSQLILVMGVVPLLAPSMGGLLLQCGFHWRVIFWIGTLYALLALMLVFAILPETLPVAARIELHPIRLFTRYLAIMREREFLLGALTGACGLFVIFAYLAGSPTLFIVILKLTPMQYGMVFGANAFFNIMSAQFTSFWVRHLGLLRTIRVAASLMVLAGCVEMWLAWYGFGGVVTNLAPITTIFIGLGLMMPLATVRAMSNHAQHAASASALLGTMQFALAAIGSAMTGYLDDGTNRPMAAMLLLGAFGALVLSMQAQHRPITALRAE